MGFKANVITKDENLTSILTDDDRIQVTVYHETCEIKGSSIERHSEKMLSFFATDVDGLNMSYSIENSIERPRVDNVRITWDPDMTDYGEKEPDAEGQLFVMAHCTVSHKDGEDCRRLLSFSSVGLFSIHPDLFNDTTQRIAMEVQEIRDLRNHLKHFNVDMASYDKRVEDFKSYLQGEKI